MYKIKIQRNGSEKFNGSWVPGDTVEITLTLDTDQYRSKIEIVDTNNNLRFRSTRGGSNNRLIAILPKTKYWGLWLVLIFIENQGEVTSIDFELPYQQYDRARKANITEIAMKTEIIENTQEEFHSSTTDEQNDIELDVMRTSNNDNTSNKQVKKDFTEPIERQVKKNTDETPDIENKEVATIAPPDITIAGLSKEEIKETLETIMTEEDLERVQAIGISELQKIEFEIPVAEIIDMDKKYFPILKNEGIQYISHILITKPAIVKQISKASLIEVKMWYNFCYEIYKNNKHPLRKEYRKIRMEYEEAQRQLKTLMDSEKSSDTLEVLSGVSTASKNILEKAGIISVIDLLQKTLLELIDLEVDKEKPLLPKLWIANAKSHLGIH